MGENIRTEDFGFEAQKYITDMIIVAPQLNDWGQTSADQTIELTQYFLTHYIINPSKVYINGYSGGGEEIKEVSNENKEKDNHRGNSGFLSGSHGGLYLSVYRG